MSSEFLESETILYRYGLSDDVRFTLCLMKNGISPVVLMVQLLGELPQLGGGIA